ncbi:hypothetical protein HYZ78_00235 [Candidatus Microgenomates bacterium]|nr:hypothetical protein [Candidatus Microgenomates bacterium]
MGNYLITSTFIGASLDSKLFLNLYVELNEYITRNNLKDAIVLQDIHSIHTTLHYLDENFSQEKLKRIQLRLATLGKDIEFIKINHINYFYDNYKEKICYFELFNSERLSEINKRLKVIFPSNVQENSYKYIPHVTLFKIKEYAEFKKHQKNIEKIILYFLEQIATKSFKTTINIFLVNSCFEPELQIPFHDE